MTSHIARKVVVSFLQTGAASRGLEQLTPREQQVLDYLARGFLFKEIGDAMKISFDTVHSPIRKIYEKLHVRNRTGAVNKFHQAGTMSAKNSPAIV
jgi:DNA-binding NarL/FixJ family response regulator